MPIRKAIPSDIPVLNHLLEQVLLVHHKVRPDIFKESGRKFNDDLTLDVWNDNVAALRFYERLDLKPQQTIMEKILKK